MHEILYMTQQHELLKNIGKSKPQNPSINRFIFLTNISGFSTILIHGLIKIWLIETKHKGMGYKSFNNIIEDDRGIVWRSQQTMYIYSMGQKLKENGIIPTLRSRVRILSVAKTMLEGRTTRIDKARYIRPVILPELNQSPIKSVDTTHR